MESTAVVGQAFAKLDTLRELCLSLLKCELREKVSLIFYCDVPLSLEEWALLNNLVRHFLDEFAMNHLSFQIHTGGCTIPKCSIEVVPVI